MPAVRWVSWLLVVGLWACAAGLAAAETLRIRVAWGGGAERTWRGTIALSEGSLAEPQALGIEADEAGSMWLDGQRLSIAQRSARTYDGVDLLLDAPLDAKLLVLLSAAADNQPPSRIEVPLADLVEKEYHAELDQRGNRLAIRRAPADALRVRLSRRSLVFAPGEILRGELQPHLLPMEPDSKVRLTIRLLKGRTSHELWSHEQITVAGEPAAIPLEVPLPSEEGVYDVAITATHAGIFRWPQPSRAALALRQPMVERRIQVLVVQPDPPASRQSAGQLGHVVEIDPAIPKWWERFAKLPQLPRLPRLWKGPLGNGRIQSRRHALGDVAELAPSPANAEVSWEAYTLPIDSPGVPHILEVEYPSDVPQTVGISIIEPNAAGAVIPIGLDSGVDLAEEVTEIAQPPQWLRHRIPFWPRTKTPIVLITNRRSDAPAVFGKIRVLAGWQHLPEACPDAEPASGRLIAGYLDRPLLPENFSATESLGSLSDLSVDDWSTFHEAGTRLVDYLEYAGYNGLMLSVMADGSTIYPSKIVEPTPRYDTGVFFASGQDPIRKDVLEMLLRLFDRHRLQLIPALEFASPLPELESVLRAGSPGSEGIQWIGPEGKPWCEVYPPVRGMSAYYNVLHPQVQDSMLAVIRELTSTYADHPSFAGLAIQLCGYGYAQLPGPRWGMDDGTVARFQKDTKLQVPGSGPERFAERARFLDGEGRQAWLQWRAAQLSAFYRRIRDELQATRPGARLYLAGANLFSAEEIQGELKPALLRKLSMAETMLRAGIDVQHFTAADGIVLLRPETIAPRWSLAERATNLDVSQIADWQRAFQPLATPGCLFFHRPQELRVASFDQASPLRPTYTWLATQTTPSGDQNRRRFVQALAALDPQAMFDGGWLLSMGQEHATGDLVAAYRRLPAVRFEPLPEESQPVAIRTATHERSTYVYAANTASFRVRLEVRVAAPAGCQIEELTGRRRLAPLARDADGTRWTVDLAPYDLIAVRFSAPGVKLYQPSATWPEDIQLVLQRRIVELGERRAVLKKNPPVLDSPDNPDFEQPPAGEKIPGWTVTEGPGVKVTLDPNQKYNGSQAVRVSGGGAAATLISRPFEVPSTGRLSLSVWLRVADPAVEPRLRLALEGETDGQAFFHSAEIGHSTKYRINDQWSKFVVNAENLAMGSVSTVRVRFDLIGPGDVWIDEIRLSALSFSEKELIALLKLITPADVKLGQSQISDCVRVLEGYWPQFLERHVPLAQAPMSRKMEAAPAPPRATPPPPQGILSRMRQLLPEALR